MEVLKSGNVPTLVSNLEVMQLLQERLAVRKSHSNGNNISNSATTNGDSSDDGGATRKSPFQHRDWIEDTVLNHLQSSPVGGSDVKLEDMPKLVQRLRSDPEKSSQISQNGHDERLPGYGLTNAETLQVLNHLPTSLVELHLILENIEKRDSLDEEEKQTKFLRSVSEFSGRQVDVGNDGTEEGDEE